MDPADEPSTDVLLPGIELSGRGRDERSPLPDVRRADPRDVPLDVGAIELGGGGVVARVHYETGHGSEPTWEQAPLVDGPRGWCLDLTNVTDTNVRLSVAGLAGTPLTVQIGQGDPVTTGPAGGRSRTAAQLAASGFTTRGNVGQISIGE